VVSAVADGEAAAAERAMRAHIQSAKRAILGGLDGRLSTSAPRR
jgi:DNA-binding GntR family transcriptional regulator